MFTGIPPLGSLTPIAQPGSQTTSGMATPQGRPGGPGTPSVGGSSGLATPNPLPQQVSRLTRLQSNLSASSAFTPQCPARPAALGGRQTGPMASGEGGVVYTFLCPKCRQHLPLSEATPRGNVQWCIKDNNSYKALAQRWSTNRRLKDYWNSLDADSQTAWFIKWQQVSRRIPKGASRDRIRSS